MKTWRVSLSRYRHPPTPVPARPLLRSRLWMRVAHRVCAAAVVGCGNARKIAGSVLARMPTRYRTPKCAVLRRCDEHTTTGRRVVHRVCGSGFAACVQQQNLTAESRTTCRSDENVIPLTIAEIVPWPATSLRRLLLAWSASRGSGRSRCSASSSRRGPRLGRH